MTQKYAVKQSNNQPTNQPSDQVFNTFDIFLMSDVEFYLNWGSRLWNSELCVCIYIYIYIYIYKLFKKNSIQSH